MCRSREARKGTETPNPAGKGRWPWDPANPKKAQNMGSRGGLTLLCLELGTAHSQCLINVSIVDCHFEEVRAEISNSFL